MDTVPFFENTVECAYCGEETFAVVVAYSGTINCGKCDEIVFDARNTSGAVVILELEEGMMH